MNSAQPPTALRDRILQAAASRPSQTRRAHAVRALGLVAGSVAVAVAIFFWFGAVRITGRPIELVIGTAMGTAIVAAAATYLALSRKNSMMGRPRVWLLTSAVTAPLLMLAWKIAYSGRFAHATDAWPERVGFRCLRLGLMTGVLPLLAVLFARRGTDPTHPRTLGFAIGMSIGLCSAELVDLWCPVAYLPHLLLGHVLPATLLGVLGSLLGGALLLPKKLD